MCCLAAVQTTTKLEQVWAHFLQVYAAFAQPGQAVILLPVVRITLSHTVQQHSCTVAGAGRSGLGQTGGKVKLVARQHAGRL